MSLPTFVPYSVAYDPVTDAYAFTLPSIPGFVHHVGRVGFSMMSLSIADAVTFFSKLSTQYCVGDGITVRYSDCTSPVAGSIAALYAAIQALYVPATPVVPMELQSFRHGAEKQTLKAGNTDPSYVNWYQAAADPWDFEFNSEARFDFPDQQTVAINQAGVYRYDVCVAARSDSVDRAWTMFLDTSGGPIASEPKNPQLGAVAQVAYPPTWQGSQTLTTCKISGVSHFDAGTQLRVAYVTEADLTTVEHYTYWSMTYQPDIVNGGAQGPPGPAGADGADGVVQSITGLAPIVVGGTAADPVISAPTVLTGLTVTAPLVATGPANAPNIAHQTPYGGASTLVVPYNINVTASGHITSAQSSTNAWFSIALPGTDTTVATAGVIPNRTFTVNHAPSGITAGTYAYPISITFNNRGHATAITPGSGPPELLANKNQPNGYAGLGPGGKILASQIPAIAITSTTLVANYADLVTITTAEEGDVGIVISDPDPTLIGTYILGSGPYNVLSSWNRMLPPTSAGLVYSVDGMFGPNVVTANNVPILHQVSSSGSPGNNIIRRIGNSTESSYVLATTDLDAVSGGDIRVQADLVLLLSAYGGAQSLGMTASFTELDLGNKDFFVTNLQSGTAAGVLYYDPGTGAVTHGAAPTSSGGVATQFAGAMSDINALTGSLQLITPVIGASVGSITLPANTLQNPKAVRGVIHGRMDTTAASPIFTFVMGINGTNSGPIIGAAITAGPYSFRIEFMFIPNTSTYRSYATITPPSGAPITQQNGGVWFGATNVPLDCQPLVQLNPPQPGDRVYDMVYTLEILS